MRKRQDPYSLENIVAAINLACPTSSDAEKRAVLERMTAEVEQTTLEARSTNTSTPSQSK